MKVKDRLDKIEDDYYEKRRFHVGDVLWLLSIIKEQDMLEQFRLREENAALKLHILSNERELAKYAKEEESRTIRLSR